MAIALLIGSGARLRIAVASVKYGVVKSTTLSRDPVVGYTNKYHF